MGPKMTRKNFVRSLFMVSGLLLLSLAYILQMNQQGIIAEVAKDFGVVLLSIVMLDYIWNKVGGDLSDIEGRDNVVSRVYLIPEEMGNEDKLTSNIEKAKHRIDLQGLTLGYVATSQKILAALRKKIIAGVKVRIVILSPLNPLICDLPGFKSFKFPETLKNQCENFAVVFKEFQKEIESIKNKRGQFEFILCRSQSLAMAFRRFDDKIYIVHYMPNRNTTETPVYYIKESENRKLFKAYVKAFEEQFTELREQD